MLWSKLTPFCLVAAALACGDVLAKCRTNSIELSSRAPAASMRLTDTSVVARFNIWNGPGVSVSDASIRYQGMFIDWPRGQVALRPQGLQRYRVEFLCEGRRPGYVVFYEFDPAVAGGYFYLPSRRDPEGVSNTSMIYHGVEGRWFHSAEEWERLVRPQMQGAVQQPISR